MVSEDTSFAASPSTVTQCANRRKKRGAAWWPRPQAPKEEEGGSVAAPRLQISVEQRGCQAVHFNIIRCLVHRFTRLLRHSRAPAHQHDPREGGGGAGKYV